MRILCKVLFMGQTVGYNAIKGVKMMQLQKRDCDVKIELTPSGTRYLDIDLDFCGQKISFGASSAVGGQFGDFVSAVYALYHEDDDCHNEWSRREGITAGDDRHIIGMTTMVDWDNEGEGMTIEMTKYWEGDNTNQVAVRITTDYGETYVEFKINERDLCYAVAKACTDALKKYGFYGYRYSTEMDTFDLHKLLFIKARALDCSEVRELLNADQFSQKTDFNKEIDLLLFDM